MVVAVAVQDRSYLEKRDESVVAGLRHGPYDLDVKNERVKMLGLVKLLSDEQGGLFFFCPHLMK